LGVVAVRSPVLAAGAAVVLVLAVVVWRRPVLIAYGLTVVLPLMGGLARGAVIPYLRAGQALLVVGFLLFLVARPTRLGKFRLTYIDLAFALFLLAEAVYPVLALYYRGEHLNLNAATSVYGVTPLQTLLGPVQYYVLYRIVVSTVTTDQEMRRIIELTLAASVVVAVIGIAETFLPSVKQLVVTYYPPVVLQGDPTAAQSDRITSTLQHYSGLGAYLTFTIVLALACYSAERKAAISPGLLILTLVVNSVALVLTLTIAAWIGLAVGVLSVLLVRGRVTKTVGLVIVGLATATLVFQNLIVARLNQQVGSGAAQGFLPQSLGFRVTLWQDVFLPAIGQHLFLGAGPEPAVLAVWNTPESQYLYLLLRGGLFYFFAYFLLMGLALGVGRKCYKSPTNELSRAVGLAMVAIVIALAVMNVSAEYFTFAGGTQIFWSLLALVVVAGWIHGHDRQAFRLIGDQPFSPLVPTEGTKLYQYDATDREWKQVSAATEPGIYSRSP
jgi:hypothetical protein